MRLPWNKSKDVQLDLLDAESATTAWHQPVEPAPSASVPQVDSGAISPAPAKLDGHDPFTYLKDILSRLPTQPNSRISELLPHRWLPNTSP